MVMRPSLFLPPVFFSVTTNDFSGFDAVIDKIGALNVVVGKRPCRGGGGCGERDANESGVKLRFYSGYTIEIAIPQNGEATLRFNALRSLAKRQVLLVGRTRCEQ